ncbi:AbiH family protein [Flavobacterium flavipallidum]|uniref:AbiH family protein n=1 Tax=Flavobacterium flavipallidum TaxID=3139140 RepID=A0ABU9HM70_9FLAO
MSKILITGNGFDLFHHLPTKYNHFISIMKTIEKFEFKKEVSFTDLFGRFFKDNFPKDFDLIIENYDVEKIEFDNSKIKRLEELLQKNPWYEYFKTVLEIETWIDFESEIEVVLNRLNYFRNNINTLYLKENFIEVSSDTYYDLELLGVIKIISNRIIKLQDRYFNKRKFSIEMKLILEDLSKSFEDFIIIFNRYLVDIVSVFYPFLKQKILIPFHLIDEIYTFNYTPTLENIYGVDESKVIYLHGEINDDSYKQNLVLGVSDILDELKQYKSYSFTKYYQKIKKNSNNKYVSIPLKKVAYHEETFFYVIGHSLDMSDKEYIVALFEFLEHDILNKSKIYIFYYNDIDKDCKIRNLLSIQKEEVVSRLHRENRLCFVELNTENLDIEFNKELYKHNVVF